MKMKNLFILISICAFTACSGQTAPPTGNQVLKATNSKSTAPPNDAVSASVSPTAPPDKTKIRTFGGKGVVTKINLELISVELDHEEIKGLMPKMTMEFYVREKSELEKLKVGDAVDFVLEDNAGAEQIVSIKKAK
jgi:Cu/Ag efflux protein CusF